MEDSQLAAKASLKMKGGGGREGEQLRPHISLNVDHDYVTYTKHINF